MHPAFHAVRAHLTGAELERLVERGRRQLARMAAGARRLEPHLHHKWVVRGFIVVAACAAALAADVLITTPSAKEIRGLAHMPVATVVFDRHDAPAFTIFQERRYEVPLDAMSPHLVRAVRAVEDERFYEHGGLDLWRIGGAAWANLRSGEWAQGGSTITQQLARLSFLTPEKSLRRKLKEAFLAIRIERQFDKPAILETYLNKVYLGAGLYGVEAASRGYFDKSASELDLDEAAMLAGLIQAPSAYAPTTHPDRALERRAVVLARMAEAGMIDEATAREVAGAPLALADGFARERTGAYFKQAVARELVDRFGWDLVSKGGLRVFATLDPAAQRAAEQALVRGLDEIEGRRAFRHPKRGEPGVVAEGRSPDYLQGALVALDPATGEVRALVGGRDFDDSQFDRVTQARRQAGSAFKPFVYAAALDLGYSPATLVTGLDRPIPTPEGPWLPADGHAGEVAMTMRTALRTSSNRAAAQVLQAVGIHQAVSYAERLGMTAPPVPSLVLGSGDVTLISLTTAYGAFANGGLLQAPYLIRRVEDASGQVLMAAEPAPRRVVSEQTAYQMAQMLADVVNRGTGWRARQAGFRQPAAGKTGTTNEYRDAWFVGFTPDLVAGVWIGFDRPRTILPGGYAGDLAVPIWGRFMRDATEGHEGRWLERPDDIVAVEICRESGLRPGAGCQRVRRVSADGKASVTSAVGIEYFRRGQVPAVECPIHDYSWFEGSASTSFRGATFPASAVIGELPGRPFPEPERAGARGRAGDDPRERDRGFWSRLFGALSGGGGGGRGGGG